MGRKGQPLLPQGLKPSSLLALGGIAKSDTLIRNPWPHQRGSGFVGFFLLLDRHVLQFTGLENVAAFLAFHIFGFFVTGDNLYPGVFALFGTDFLLGGLRRLANRHKLVDCSTIERR
jgi:hypothetical protein